MDFKTLMYFTSAAETLNFSKTAEAFSVKRGNEINEGFSGSLKVIVPGVFETLIHTQNNAESKIL